MKKIKKVINGRETFKIEFFEVPRNTRFRFHRYEKDRRVTLLDLPREYEGDPNFLRITDPSEFTDIFDTASGNVQHHLDEWAVYVHKLDPHFKWGKFMQYKLDLIELIGEDKAYNKLYQYNLKLEDLTYYELEAFFSELLNLTINLNREDEEITAVDVVDLKEADKDWDEYKKEELKTMCKHRGLTVGGTVKELIERLKEDSKVEKIEESSTLDVSKIELPELQTMLMNKGMNVHGTVEELRERILQSGLF